MTKQEEIREGVFRSIESARFGVLDAHIDGSNIPITDIDPFRATKAVLSYLHSQGVAIRVDTELPISCGHAQMTAYRYSQDVTCPLLEAGDVALVEPLIKED